MEYRALLIQFLTSFGCNLREHCVIQQWFSQAKACGYKISDYDTVWETEIQKNRTVWIPTYVGMTIAGGPKRY